VITTSIMVDGHDAVVHAMTMRGKSVFGKNGTGIANARISLQVRLTIKNKIWLASVKPGYIRVGGDLGAKGMEVGSSASTPLSFFGGLCRITGFYLFVAWRQYFPQAGGFHLDAVLSGSGITPEVIT